MGVEWASSPMNAGRQIPSSRPTSRPPEMVPGGRNLAGHVDDRRGRPVSDVPRPWRRWPAVPALLRLGRDRPHLYDHAYRGYLAALNRNQRSDGGTA